MIPSNLENMGKCLPLIKRVRCRELNYASSSLGIRGFLQLHSRVCRGGRYLPLAFADFAFALLSARRAGYTPLVSATVTRLLFVLSHHSSAMPEPKRPKAHPFRQQCIVGREKNVQTRPDCNPVFNYLSVKYFIWIIFGPFNLDEKRYSR